MAITVLTYRSTDFILLFVNVFNIVYMGRTKQSFKCCVKTTIIFVCV